MVDDGWYSLRSPVHICDQSEYQWNTKVNQPVDSSTTRKVNFRARDSTPWEVKTKSNELCQLAEDVSDSHRIGNSSAHKLVSCWNAILCRCSRRTLHMPQSLLADSVRVSNVLWCTNCVHHCSWRSFSRIPLHVPHSWLESEVMFSRWNGENHERRERGDPETRSLGHANFLSPFRPQDA